jgi:DNA-binding phage protein
LYAAPYGLHTVSGIAAYELAERLNLDQSQIRVVLDSLVALGYASASGPMPRGSFVAGTTVRPTADDALSDDDSQGSPGEAGPPETGETFSELLGRLRRAQGISMAQLAERTGLSRERIAALERGRRRPPPLRIVALVAHALGLSMSQQQRLEVLAQRQSGAPVE